MCQQPVNVKVTDNLLVCSFLFEWSIGQDPTSRQPTRTGLIQTANQKLHSIHKARKTPEMGPICRPRKGAFAGSNRDLQSEGATSAPAL